MSVEQVTHVFDYTNHRGERGKRRISPRRLWFGETDWHTTRQWLLEAYDHDRQEARNFALTDIEHWETLPVDVPLGLYRHFKGEHYLVTGSALHSESGQMMVIYRELYGEFRQWVRPLQMFVANVETEDGPRPRFEFV